MTKNNQTICNEFYEDFKNAYNCILDILNHDSTLSLDAINEKQAIKRVNEKYKIAYNTKLHKTTILRK